MPSKSQKTLDSYMHMPKRSSQKMNPHFIKRSVVTTLTNRLSELADQGKRLLKLNLSLQGQLHTKECEVKAAKNKLLTAQLRIDELEAITEKHRAITEAIQDRKKTYKLKAYEAAVECDLHHANIKSKCREIDSLEVEVADVHATHALYKKRKKREHKELKMLIADLNTQLALARQ